MAAGALEAAGLSVAVLPLQNFYPGFNEGTHMRELDRLLEEHPARVVLFASDHFIASRSTAGLYGIRMITNLLTRKSPRPLIGISGRLATSSCDRLLDLAPGLDFLVLGEAEAALGPLVRTALENGLAGLDAEPSVVTRARLADGAEERVFLRVDDPDSLPLPAYHLLERAIATYDQLRASPLPQIPFSMRTTFGCRFQCKFCAGVPNWRTYRKKSAGRVGAELDALVSAVGDRGRLSFLEDEIFTLDRGHVENIAAIFKQRHIRLDGLYTHSAVLDEGIASVLHQFTDKVFMGLDSPDDRILKEMRKGQRLDTVLGAVEVARRAGLKAHLEWIVGAPGEDVDSLIASLVAIFNLLITGSVDSINTYVFCPHPGTDYAENHYEYGLEIVEDFEWMQESGGYPASETAAAARVQVFVAYLMSQLVIAEATQARRAAGPEHQVFPANVTALREIFARLMVRQSSEMALT